MATVLLLLCSNVFMTTAWYWHLRTSSSTIRGVWPLLTIILISWLIALPEYALAVPANRLGASSLGGTFSAWQLKILQEGIALAVFVVFVLIYLRELPRWQDLAGLALIAAGLLTALWRRALPSA